MDHAPSPLDQCRGSTRRRAQRCSAVRARLARACRERGARRGYGRRAHELSVAAAMTGFAGVWTPEANTAASLLSQMVDATLAPISPSLTLAAWGRARVLVRPDSGIVVAADA